jgi:hypothetical protein
MNDQCPYPEFFKDQNEINAYVRQFHDKDTIIRLLSAYKTPFGTLRVNYEYKPSFEHLSYPYLIQKTGIQIPKEDIFTWRIVKRNTNLNILLNE